MLEAIEYVQTYHPWFLQILVFIFGAIVGSFLNVCIYRIPAEKSVVTPGSHCGCGKPIAWYDNIPILSWLLLRGKARCCGRPFSIRYPAIEALTGLLFLGVWMTAATPLAALAGFVFMALLVVATFIDLDHMIIPDCCTIWGMVIGVVLSVLIPSLHGYSDTMLLTGGMKGAISSISGAFVGSACILWIMLLGEKILRKEAMGFGDVTFMGMIGAFCGWQGALFAIFGGALFGTFLVFAGALLQLFFKKKKTPPTDTSTENKEVNSLGFGARVPFGPMLATGGGAYFLYFQPYVDTYIREFAIILFERT